MTKNAAVNAQDKSSNIQTISLEKYYRSDLSKLEIKIEGEHYSNIGFINLAGRDVFIDFVKLPGIVENGVPVARGIRVYMPYPAAQRLVEVLSKSISDAEKNHGIEPLRIEAGPEEGR